MPKLVIVDDEPVYVENLKSSISWHRMGITEVYSADSLQKARAVILNKDIDIMLCDIEMPGENGFDLLNWVHENHSRTQSLFLTGHADFHYAQKALKMGCVDYILKPVTENELYTAITKALNRIEMDSKIVQLSHFAQYWKNYGLVNMNQFWRDIVDRNVSSSYDCLNKEARLREVPFSIQIQFIPAVIQVQPLRKLSYAEESDLEFRIKDRCAQGVLKNHFGQMIKTMKNTFMLLMDTNHFSKSEFESNLTKEFSECRIQEEYGCKLYCCVGDPIFPNQLADVYESICLRIFAASVFRKKYIIFVDSLVNSSATKTFDISDILAGENMEKISWKARRVVLDVVQSGGMPKLEEYFFCLLQILLSVSGLKYSEQFIEAFSPRLFFSDPISVQNIVDWIEHAFQKAAVFQDAGINQESVVSKAKQYIQDHIGESLSRDTISRHVHMNPDYLNRLFKKNTEKSIMEYVTCQRIRKAKELLKTIIPIGEVSVMVGYENFSNFANMFHKNTGQSPSQYRLSLKRTSEM